MNFTEKDRSSYFKGLLLLIGKDKKITKEEKKFVLDVGKLLGFEKKFCNTAINDLLVNKYIKDTPPQFSSKHIAENFIIDSIALAVVDNDFDPDELNFVQQSAEINNIDPEWLDNQIKLLVTNNHIGSNVQNLKLKSLLN